MRDIGKGKLDFDLPGITNKDEVGVLAETFSYMRDSLKKYLTISKNNVRMNF